jgi:hypothetical protein
MTAAAAALVVVTTRSLSTWMKSFLGLYLCPAYLRDSFKLIEQLKALSPVPLGAYFITADAVSMYSNIDTVHS